MNDTEKMEILKGLESINPYDFNDCDGDPFEVVREQIENKDDVWGIIKYLLGEIDDLQFLVSEKEKSLRELQEKYNHLHSYTDRLEHEWTDGLEDDDDNDDDDGYTTEELGHFINRLEEIQKGE